MIRQLVFIYSDIHTKHTHSVGKLQVVHTVTSDGNVRLHKF